MKYLGIDYGLKKVGLAVSEGVSASPFKILEISSLKDAIDKVLHVISVEGIDKVILGMPESGESKKIAEIFLIELKTKGVDVESTPETLSSYEAREKMISLGTSKKSRKVEDSVSASIILQEYLDGKQ